MRSIPERFQVAKATLIKDRLMGNLIMVGGISIIVAVLSIFVFILIQIIPLFQTADVKFLDSEETGIDRSKTLGLAVDEWGELPVVIQADGSLSYYDLVYDRGKFQRKLDLSPDHPVSSFRFNARKSNIVFGTKDGYMVVAELGYRPEFIEVEDQISSKRVIHPDNKMGKYYQMSDAGETVIDADYGGTGEDQLALAVVGTEEQNRLVALSLTQESSLFSKGDLVVNERYDLTDTIPVPIRQIDVSVNGDSIVVVGKNDTLYYLFFDGNAFELRQTWKPFKNFKNEKIATAGYLQGDMSYVLTNPNGDVRVYSLFLEEGEPYRKFGLTKKGLESLGETPDNYVTSLRNKAFLLAGDRKVKLYYNTTQVTRWSEEMNYQIDFVAMNEKYSRIFLLDQEGALNIYKLEDPHPQVSWRAFFGKIWYEGQSEPAYLWQSTGGSDEFEPKFSLVPLIVGSLKGTFYAMMFALPIALMAAIYTSQFVTARVKHVVKPIMEIMASLPSVVLGFLAALWLAPIVDGRVPSFLIMVIMIPLTMLILGWLWQKMPITIRVKLPKGTEFVTGFPLILIVGYLSWQLGPVVEKIFFTVTNPETGKTVADFRLWWPEATGATYTQRNSLVVGFMMGFAVIPIIFTIAEDAMSNVPQALRSGSLALGASRWQTAARIVLPTAAAGIFSAVMIGFGRAVGETMIVVMATGNTPVMDMNIFSGMRTLSANIAVELPEAPVDSTLYRTLFLGAMVLFLMTFIVNTFAEVLRFRLRKRYQAVE